MGATISSLVAARQERPGRQSHLERLCRQARRMRAIPRLGVASQGDPEVLFAEVCSEIPSLLDAECVALLFDDGTGLMRVHAATGLPEAASHRASVPTAEVAQLAERDGWVSVLAGGPETWPCVSLVEDLGMQNVMWVHIRYLGHVAGGLLVARQDPHAEFDEDDRLFGEVLAEYLAARVMELRLQLSLAQIHGTLQRIKRLALLGDLAGALAEEIGEATGEVIDRTEELRILAGGRVPPRPLDAIMQEVERVQVMTSPLRLSMESPDAGRRILTDLSQLVDAAVNLLGFQLARDRIRIEVVWSDNLPRVRCHIDQLRHVLLTLVLMARRSLNARWPQGEDRKELRIEGRRGTRPGSPSAEVELWDAGVGLPAALIARFHDGDPTDWPLDDGPGLVLHVCREILREHDGLIQVDSVEGSYTRVVLVLPLEEIS